MIASARLPRARSSYHPHPDASGTLPIVSRVDEYRRALRQSRDFDAYLRAHSGLPGPRGNLELAAAAAAEGDRRRFDRYLRLTPEQAPENTPEVFLVFCGVLGCGRLLAEGDLARLATLRRLANDPRWRVRESVAMALQSWGDVDTPSLVREMRGWMRGSLLEQRAAVAALCEPRLLTSRRTLTSVFSLLDQAMRRLQRSADRHGEPFRVLRQGLGYAWSVALAADFELGRTRFERWVACDDPDLRWIVRQNLTKNRLQRAAPEWARRTLAKAAR